MSAVTIRAASGVTLVQGPKEVTVKSRNVGSDHSRCEQPLDVLDRSE